MAQIAVVIPVYNRGTVVMRAVESVLRQDLADFELIVVDDASTDGSADVVAAVRDPRLRLLRQPANRGANAARNRGIREATAPLVALLDSDDEFLPEKLSTVVAMFERQADLDTLLDSYLVSHPRRDGGRQRPRVNPAIDTSAQFLAALFDRTKKHERLRISASGMTMRTAVAIRAGLFDEAIRVRQDMEFLARLAKAGRTATTARILWIKYDLPDGITAARDGFMAATIAMCRQHPEMLAGGGADGLARDVVRSLWAAAKRGRWRRVRDETALLAREFGAVRAARLAVRGLAVLRPRAALSSRQPDRQGSGQAVRGDGGR